MDANGSRFQLLQGLDDWATCDVVGFPREGVSSPWWDEGWHAVRLPSRSFRFPASAGDAPPDLAARRGAGVDAYGNWYWIDTGDDNQPSVIRVKSAGSRGVSTFWATGAEISLDPRSVGAGDFAPCDPPLPRPRRLIGLAVTASHYLVAGIVDPAGLLVFDLHAGGPPRPEVWFPGFAPFDMAPAPDGGVWMLERATAGAPARLWRLDARLQICRLTPQPMLVTQPTPDFHPIDAAPERPLPSCDPSPPPGPDPAAALTLTDVGDAIAVESLADGSALLLIAAAADRSLLWRYDLRLGLHGPFAPMARRGLLEETDAPTERIPFPRAAHDMAFVPGADPELPPRALPGRLFLVDQSGNQAFAFALTEIGGGATLDVDLLPEYRPMRLFGGRALVTFGETAFYDSGQDWAPLAAQPRPRYATELTVRTPLPPDGAANDVRHAFDGRDPDCVWHRLLLDGCLPETTSITVRTRAANSERDLAIAEWRTEPPLYRRREGSELPYVQQPQARDWGTVETLFQAARGRFLQVEITLHGDGRSSPRLRALRAYFPRFSYLNHYLPAVYREDALSASFLDRFLANLEGINTAAEDRIDAVRALMDTRSAPAAYLDWLAGWFNAVLDPHWEETRRRLFIAYAPELFRQRGTLPGLIRAIRLATDPCPDESIFTAAPDELQGEGRPAAVRIVEHFRTRAAPGLIFGDPAGAEGPGLTTAVSTWRPELGAAPLHAQFQTYLGQRYTTQALQDTWGKADVAQIRLPPTRPSQPVRAADWERFLRAELGFTYAPVTRTAADRKRYQHFLARRYGTIERYKRAHGLAGTTTPKTFADIVLPTLFPDAGTPLRDWIQFVSILLPTERNAHRFTILAPTVAGADTFGRADLSERIRQVVALEKPAHTVFDIREYWAAFRVGEARLGFDTVVDRGSRLFAIALGRGGLAEGYLDYGHPWSATGRTVLGPSPPPWPDSLPGRPSFMVCPHPPGGSV